MDNQNPQNPPQEPASQPTPPPAQPTPPPPVKAPVDLNELLGTKPAVANDGSKGPGSVITGIAMGFSAVFAAIFSWIIFPVAVVLILHNFVFQAYHVIGTSMVPNLHDADYLIISKVGNTQAAIGRAFGQDDKYLPARGQIIVFHFPKDTSRVFVKRVVGLPGDRIVVKNGSVTIYNAAHKDGFNPDKNYELAGTVTMIDTDEVVQPGNVFVMGDNRSPNGSYDSREWGELPSSYIIGNAVLRLLPLDQAKTL